MENNTEILQVLQEFDEKLSEELARNSEEFLKQVNHGFNVLLDSSTREFLKNVQHVMKKETIYMIRSLNSELIDLRMPDDIETGDMKLGDVDTFMEKPNTIKEEQEYAGSENENSTFERELAEAVGKISSFEESLVSYLDPEPFMDKEPEPKSSIDIKDLFILKNDEKNSKDANDVDEKSLNKLAKPAAFANKFVYVCSEGNCDGIICMGRKIFITHLMSFHNFSEEHSLHIANKQRWRQKDARKRLKGVQPVKCNECNKEFKGIYCHRALRKHRRKHLAPEERALIQEKQGMCTECGKTMNAQSLANHMDVIHGNQEFPCEIEGCEKVFKSLVSLKSHAKFCDTVQNCPECDKTFKRPDTLRTHIRVTHEGRPLEEKECPECGKMVILKYLNQHIAMNHGTEEIPCERCDKIFSSKPALKHHQSTCNNYVKCDECGKIMGKSNLKYHMLASHSSGDVKGEKCLYCPASYIKRSQLTFHMRCKHLQYEKPFPCQLCPKAFMVKSELALHVGTHDDNDEREFECDQCENSYKRKNHLYRHIRVSHDPNFVADEVMEKEQKYLNSLNNNNDLENISLATAAY